MKYMILVYSLVLSAVLGLVILASGCAQAPTSPQVMAECKKICRGPVLHYQDDTIECVCKGDKK